MIWLLYSLLASLPLIYWCLTRNFNYWSKRGIKGPRPVPFFGNTLHRGLIATAQNSEQKWLKKYGKVYGTYEGSRPVLKVADPELIKMILVKDFQIFPDRRPSGGRSLHPIMKKGMVEVNGDDWRRIRSIISPTFTSGKMKRMYPLINECLNDFTDHLEGFAKDGQEINVKDIYGNFTMDVIATCAFATKINSHKQLDSTFVVNARKRFDFNMLKVILGLILPEFAMKILYRTSTSSDDFFIDQIRQIMEKRKKSDKRFNDFLQMALDVQKGSEKSAFAEKEELDTSESHHVNEGEEEMEVNRKTLSLSSKDRYLTEDEIMAQAVIFLLAGYETTATTLMYITYELALNPDIQERLHEEVMSALDSEGEISYEVLSKLPYLDAVLSETLRLHSPAISNSRVASQDYKLGNTGLTVEKGTIVQIANLAVMLQEEYYPDPFKFNPDRFMPENRAKLVAYTYLPFGAGPRNCIGMRFALLEAKLGLVHIVKRFRFKRSQQTDVPIKIKKSILNTPQRLFVSIHER